MPGSFSGTEDYRIDTDTDIVAKDLVAYCCVTNNRDRLVELLELPEPYKSNGVIELTYYGGSEVDVDKANEKLLQLFEYISSEIISYGVVETCRDYFTDPNKPAIAIVNNTTDGYSAIVLRSYGGPDRANTETIEGLDYDELFTFLHSATYPGHKVKINWTQTRTDYRPAGLYLTGSSFFVSDETMPRPYVGYKGKSLELDIDPGFTTTPLSLDTVIKSYKPQPIEELEVKIYLPELGEYNREKARWWAEVKKLIRAIKIKVFGINIHSNEDKIIKNSSNIPDNRDILLLRTQMVEDNNVGFFYDSRVKDVIVTYVPLNLTETNCLIRRTIPNRYLPKLMGPEVSKSVLTKETPFYGVFLFTEEDFNLRIFQERLDVSLTES